MLYYLLWLGIVLVVFLFLRIWQPELIYSFRKTLVNVRTRKAFIDFLSGRDSGTTTFSELLIKDSRYESRIDDTTYALRRSMKLRELYQMLDLRRDDVPGLPAKRKKPQVCIIELSNLLGNLARKLHPDVEYNYPTLGANTLLAFIGNEIIKSRAEERRARGEVVEEEPPLLTETQVETWFTENPMSIEQTIEILITAVNGLAFRHRAQVIAQQRAVAGSFFLFNRKEEGARLPKQQRAVRD